MGVDGILCYEDYTAMGLILELLTRSIRIPDDISIAGFDDLPIGSSFSLGLTTYALSLDEITRWAFELMRERIRHPDRPPVQIVIPGKLIVRESTAGQETGDRGQESGDRGQGSGIREAGVSDS
jgi:LacI family transcriptional regulator